MARKKPERWRCLTVGCNPVLKHQKVAEQHRDQTGHRIARWPVRSAEGHRKQRERNREQWETTRELLGLQPDGFLIDREAEAEYFGS